MASLQITFDGFDKLAKEIEAAGKKLKPAADEALKETQKMIQRELTTAASPYAKKGGGLKGYATGKMYKTLLKSVTPKWEGTTATIKVGFNLKQKAGQHSIFIMYGTARHPARNQYGSPKKSGAKATHMNADKKVFDAIFGTRIKDRIAKKQEEIMRKYLRIGD